jgi:hypothetical protein
MESTSAIGRGASVRILKNYWGLLDALCLYFLAEPLKIGENGNHYLESN